MERTTIRERKRLHVAGGFGREDGGDPRRGVGAIGLQLELGATTNDRETVGVGRTAAIVAREDDRPAARGQREGTSEGIVAQQLQGAVPRFDETGTGDRAAHRQGAGGDREGFGGGNRNRARAEVEAVRADKGEVTGHLDRVIARQRPRPRNRVERTTRERDRPTAEAAVVAKVEQARSQDRPTRVGVRRGQRGGAGADQAQRFPEATDHAVQGQAGARGGGQVDGAIETHRGIDHMAARGHGQARGGDAVIEREHIGVGPQCEGVGVVEGDRTNRPRTAQSDGRRRQRIQAEIDDRTESVRRRGVLPISAGPARAPEVVTEGAVPIRSRRRPDHDLQGATGIVQAISLARHGIQDAELVGGTVESGRISEQRVGAVAAQGEEAAGREQADGAPFDGQAIGVRHRDEVGRRSTLKGKTRSILQQKRADGQRARGHGGRRRKDAAAVDGRGHDRPDADQGRISVHRDAGVGEGAVDLEDAAIHLRWASVGVVAAQGEPTSSHLNKATRARDVPGVNRGGIQPSDRQRAGAQRDVAT